VRYKTYVITVVAIAAVGAGGLLLSIDGRVAVAKKPDMQVDMTALKEKLESGDTFQRAEPFTLRPFEPYIDSTWLGHAVAYGPYREGQAPGGKGPSDAELLEDLKIISQHWQLIRLYGADNDTKRILRVIKENELPIKVVQGIWLSPESDNPKEREANIRSTLLGIELTNQYPDIVIAVNVGNETQVDWSAHRMDSSILIRYLRAVRRHVTVPVTTADDYLYWITAAGQALAEETDFVFTHLHPQWNGRQLEGAISWMDSVYNDLQDLHPERPIVIGETGWATDYNADKDGPGEQGALVKGTVGIEAQGEFLLALHQWVEKNRVTTFLFEAFDEPWKGGGESTPPNEIEKNWGVYYENRTPKASMSELQRHVQSSSD